MATCIFGWPIVSDSGSSFSGGSWAAALPLTNLVNAKLAVVARSSDALAASTQFDIDLGSAKSIRVFSLIGHNLQSTATIRVRGSNSAGVFTSPIYDTGTVDVWPEQWPTGTLPAGHPNEATRRLTNAQILRRRWPWVHVATSGQSARYWRFEITDTGNTDGYVQIGRLVMSPGYQPSVNLSYGSIAGTHQIASVETSLGGADLVDARGFRRSVQLGWPDMPLTEIEGVLQEMKLDCGIEGQLLYVFDPTDTYYMQRRSFLARFLDLAPIEHAFYDAGKSSIDLIEVI